MTTETQPKRPPNDRGQGRKPKPPEQRMVVMPLRMTPAQKDKLTAMGGAKWVRDRLDEAAGEATDPQTGIAHAAHAAWNALARLDLMIRAQEGRKHG